MRAFLVIFALGGGLAIAGCTPPRPVHDKAYYLAHPDERAAAIAECRNNPGALANTPNCVNASAADADAESARFWTTKRPQSRVANPGSL
jgi:hypothetical protein